MADEIMPKFDPAKDKHLVNKATLDFMEVMNKKNLERATELKRVRLRNTFTGLGLATFVLGIYSYSIFSVKQETFLDDFEPPVLVPKTEIKN